VGILRESDVPISNILIAVGLYSWYSVIFVFAIPAFYENA